MDGRVLGDGDIENSRSDLEHAFHDAIDGEVWAQDFVIDIEVFLALHFGVVGGFPWFEGLGSRVGFRGLVLGELFGFLEEGGLDLVMEALHEGERVEAVARHAALEDE